MLKRTFDFYRPYRYVVYLRMSSDSQNPRSPEQQLAEIKKCLKALRYPWTIVKIYREDAVSGRYLRKRPQYQEMIHAIKTGALTVDLILVDTLERFGRVEAIDTIRKQLYQDNGVLVLTADTKFADPTTPQGKALGMFEAMRASEDGRIKAHNVLRGKRDAVQLGHWPGGPAPFGFMLQSVLHEVKGVQEVSHKILVPNPKNDWIIRLAFQTAAATGMGQVRLTKFLNAHPDIPDEFKPFNGATMGHWLDQWLYIGTIRWELYSTDIINDARVIERNDDADVIYVPNFCERIVPQDDWEKVQQTRAARRARLCRTKKSDKQIRPLAAGMVLKYMLSGLIRCGHCGRAMVVSASSNYTSVAGDVHRYERYGCPGYADGNCSNGRRISESWLREQVVRQLRDRLFPAV